jgi:hypothetical protein
VSIVIRILILLVGILAASTASAQGQLEFGSGATHETNRESTYGWELDYSEELGQHAYMTLGWLNEGHQIDNHRDGLNSQIWARTDLIDSKLSIAAGVGPYFYFDTVRDGPHPSYAQYENKHGPGLIYSAELTYYLDSPWLLYLRANRVIAESGSNTSMLLLGFGYRFGGRRDRAQPSAPPESSLTEGPLDDELTVALGRTSLNSFVSEGSSAYAVEYRHDLSRHVDWTVGWLEEGENNIIHRDGVTSQFWLVKPLRDDRLVLGIGAGVYVAVDQHDQTFVVMHHQPSGVDSDDDRLSGIISVMATWRFDPRWFIRGSFNRVVTHYDRDADVILLGAGYRF